MKMTIEIDCTPVEARTFLGLPDVSALNDHLVKEMQTGWTPTWRCWPRGADEELDGVRGRRPGAIPQADDGGGRRGGREALDA
jgi:hypothetical protein